jgi:hypothetical protein
MLKVNSALNFDGRQLLKTPFLPLISLCCLLRRACTLAASAAAAAAAAAGQSYAPLASSLASD